MRDWQYGIKQRKSGGVNTYHLEDRGFRRYTKKMVPGTLAFLAHRKWRHGSDVTWKVDKMTYAGYSAVDLCSILALWVRVLWGGHLQHAHSKGIYIHWLVVLLLIHLRRHELRGTLNQNNYSELSHSLTDWVGFSQPIVLLLL